MNKEDFIKKWKYRTINNGFTSEIYDCEKELRSDLNELEKAQAEIAALKADKVKDEQAIADAKAAALAAQNALAETQAATRQTAIDKLAADTGRTFTDEQVTAFNAMDEAQFNVVAAVMQPVPKDTPVLPAGLDKEQATSGRQSGESKIMAAVEAAKAQGAK